MQFRFRIFDIEGGKYKLITLINVENYDIMFKTLTFMAEHKCEYCIEINTENMVDTVGEEYEVVGVSLCVSSSHGEDGLIPHFVVDLEEC